MRNRWAGRGIALLLGLVPAVVSAWGSYGHQLINERAVDDLPAAMWDDGFHNGFNAWRDDISTHSTDPDSIKSKDTQEGVRHYCDIDSNTAVYPAPFDAVPRDYATYCAATATGLGRDNGVVMWEGVVEHTDALVIAFRARNWMAVKQCAADLGHYVADSYQPFHGTANYDGQLSGQSGIHSRYETDLIEAKVTTADIRTRRSANPLGGTSVLVPDVTEAAFQMISHDNALVGPALAADLVAKGVDPSYGTAYLNSMFSQVGGDMVDQVTNGAVKLADLWYTAWVRAGSPDFDPVPHPVSLQNVVTTIDGSLAEYPATNILQTTTSDQYRVSDFADNQSELDQCLAGVDGNFLSLGIAGNLASAHALVILVDTVSGGSSTLSGLPGPAFLAALPSTTVASGFQPDFAITIVRPSSYTVTLVNLQTRAVTTLGSSASTSFALSDGGAFAFNNTNTGGVKDRNGRVITDAENVRTGIELKIAKSSLGLDTTHVDAKMLMFVARNSTTSYISNQSLPGMPLGAFNLGNKSSYSLVDQGYFLLRTPQVTGGLVVY